MGQATSKESPAMFSGCCCDYKAAIFASKVLEEILETNFGAEGQGLHEKISTANGLDEVTQRRLRRIATIRNKIVHAVGYDVIDCKPDFRKECSDLVNLLKGVDAPVSKTSSPNVSKSGQTQSTEKELSCIVM